MRHLPSVAQVPQLYSNFVAVWCARLFVHGIPVHNFGVAYDMQEENHALLYLPALLGLTQEKESLTDLITVFRAGNLPEQQTVWRQAYKSPVVIPQVTVFIPGHFAMDTKALILLLVPPYHNVPGIPTKSRMFHKPADFKHVWGYFFKINKSIFRKCDPNRGGPGKYVF